MSEELKAWAHPKCMISSDEVEQPPRGTKGSLNRCYRCGVGATNIQPVLRMCIIHEPIVEAVIVPSQVVMDVVKDTSKEEEIARLRAEIEALE